MEAQQKGGALQLTLTRMCSFATASRRASSSGSSSSSASGSGAASPSSSDSETSLSSSESVASSSMPLKQSRNSCGSGTTRKGTVLDRKTVEAQQKDGALRLTS
eukprot:SAG22_NODE_3695_length_1572_cov_1.479973_1_plen_103_part_10